MTRHLSDETIARFVDRRVSNAEQHNILEHMADCQACFDIVVGTAATMRELESRQPVEPARSGLRRTIIDIVMIGALVAVVLFVGCP